MISRPGIVPSAPIPAMLVKPAAANSDNVLSNWVAASLRVVFINPLTIPLIIFDNGCAIIARICSGSLSINLICDVNKLLSIARPNCFFTKLAYCPISNAPEPLNISITSVYSFCGFCGPAGLPLIMLSRIATVASAIVLNWLILSS